MKNESIPFPQKDGIAGIRKREQLLVWLVGGRKVLQEALKEGI